MKIELEKLGKRARRGAELINEWIVGERDKEASESNPPYQLGSEEDSIH